MPHPYLTELIKVQVRQLDERIAEQYADLRQRLDELRLAQEDFASAMLTRLDAHEDYHRRNEHRWGLLKLAGRYPFRFAALTAGFLIALESVLPHSGVWLARIFSHLAGMEGK